MQEDMHTKQRKIYAIDKLLADHLLTLLEGAIFLDMPAKSVKITSPASLIFKRLIRVPHVVEPV